MKIAHLADVHLDAQFGQFPRDVARRRRHALEAALKAAVERAQQERVDALFVAGDLYEHDRVAPNTANFVRTLFAELAPTPVFITPGNHDWYGPASLYARVDWTPNVHIFAQDELRPHEVTDGLTLWGAAHRAPRNTDGFLDGFHVDRGGVNVALFHGSEQGALRFQEDGKVPHSPFRADQIEQAGLGHAFVGHFHTPVDHALYTYPGNPEPLAFGEHGSLVRGLVLAEIAADGTVRCQRVAVTQIPVTDVTVDVTGCANGQEIREKVRAELAGKPGCIRLTIEGELACDVDLELSDLERASSDPLSVAARVGRLAVAYDIESIRAEPTVRGAFVKDVLASELDDELKQRLIVTGLRALEGRSDLEVVT